MTAFLHQIFSGLAMGGVYAILALVIYARRGTWLRDPFSNMLIRKILK